MKRSQLAAHRSQLLAFIWHKFFTKSIMALSLYNKKRRFDDTPEPEGKTKKGGKELIFVIQKHDASHLHYDFRLEMEGVLKSWAVPKGPSMNPEDKRLAMMVEDHPYDYRDFEGVIPEGNYGGGTVIVWDQGSYELMDAEGMSRKEQEKVLLRQLKAGDLKLRLKGKKIKGDFALFQMKGRGERSWLLVKKRDEYATEKDILKNDKSVKTGKRLKDVAKENGTIVKHPEDAVKSSARSKPIQLLPTSPAKKSPAKKTAVKKSSKRPVKAASKSSVKKGTAARTKSKKKIHS